MPKPPDIDEDTWRIMMSYGGDPYTPRERTIAVLEEWSSGEWTLAEFQELYSKAIAQIPIALRANAKVEFEGGGYDESGSFKIYYTRPETQAEQKERASRYLEYARTQQAQERATFNRLKAKFGA